MAVIENTWLGKQITVAENEVALLYRNKKFEKVLSAGRHHVHGRLCTLEINSFDSNDLYFDDPSALQMVRDHQEIAELLHEWRVDKNEVGLLYHNDVLQGIAFPGGTLLVWKKAGKLELKKVSLSEGLEVDRSLLNEIRLRNVNQSQRLLVEPGSRLQVPVLESVVPAGHIGMLYVDGVLQQELKAGLYGFWQINHEMEVKLLDLRQKTLEVSGQEILTKDRVSIRVNLTAGLRIVDARQVAESQSDHEAFAYRALQLALREAVGTRTLDQLLEDKLHINTTVKDQVVAELEAEGIRLERVGVKDIVLPGEIRTILNRVVEAQKAAEANVIKRREETAATRSLHNTAKMMENNAILLRLKELEALEKVSEKVQNLNVYGGIDQLMKQTVRLG
ncbi:slipin family protein [Endozoicomonas numazuensis]|uniref:Stomatin/prohibitin-family membrane protease subunit n=1 Tax=Endozoicomonas numazuensis TaxID=1137799 RepID=A0A081NCR8_9GAMM|nr:slipin family protein [Endozoicomonas numazuensis]KEQ16241.1 stomatin/prohibitin-family membrane protease subunit [Endozoicomonas numazuensis]